MRTTTYRLTVIGCALSWLLLGLHLPTVHEVLDHGWSPPTSVVAVIVLLVATSIGTSWALLRAAGRPSA